MQAAKQDIAHNIENRASEQYGVPIRLNLIRRKWHQSDPETWERMATAADLCFDLSGDLECFEERCRSPEPLAQAFGVQEAMLEKTNGKRTSPGEYALYLIQVEDDPIVKIGISTQPRLRLQSIQDAHYRELSIWGVVYSPDRQVMTIEQSVLGWANQAGNRLRGEWIAAEPKEIFMRVLEVARDQNIAVCDAGVWTANLLNRTKRLMRSGFRSLRDI